MKRLGAFLLAAAFLIPAQLAGAETITTVHTVSVVGIGRVPISLTANPVEANDAYRQALAQAVGDGALKASTVASQAHARLGSIEAISESGSTILCKNPEREIGNYKGAEPDSGSAQGALVGVALAIPAKAPAPAKKKRATHKKTRRHRRLLAHKAELSPPPTCEITAQIDLIYGLS